MRGRKNSVDDMTKKETIKERIRKLRECMEEMHAAAYLAGTADFHDSEYAAPYFKCREYISGFTGSAGTCVITGEKAGLWTDGRYFIQAAEELQGTGIDLYRAGEPDVPSVEKSLGES